jgi:Spy/CpxP family protein refolding chaperone
MKKILLSMLILIMAVSISFAQYPSATKHRRHYHRHANLAKDLNFSEEQKAQLKSISRDFYQKLAVLHKDESITVKEMKDRRAAISHDYHQAFQNILTQEQKDELADLRKKNEEKRKMVAERKLDMMKEKLNLSEEQTARIRAVNEKYRDQYKKYLTMDGNDRSSKNEELSGLRKQQKEDIQAILTPDQQKQLDDCKRIRRAGSSRI